MLDWLFPPRLQRLMAALMLHPDKDYSFNDLVRIANVGNRGGQMAIASLVEGQMVRETRLGNQRRFRVNTEHPLYQELRAICVKTFGVVEPVREALSKLEGIETAFIFGSVAKGKDRPDSDIDIMAVGETDPFAWSDCAYDLERVIGRPVHLNLYPKDQWNRLVETDPVIQSIANGPKIMVIGHGKPS